MRVLRRFGTALLFLVLLVFCLDLRGILEAVFHPYVRDMRVPLSETSLAHYAYIKHHLEKPFHGYRSSQVLIKPFSIIALSNMASGLLNVALSDPAKRAEIEPLLLEVCTRALSKHVSPYSGPVEQQGEWNDHGLYLSHLNLILGCYRRVSGKPTYDSLHRALSNHLAALSLRDGDFHIRSYPRSAKWPADQTVTLCSLYLFDKNFGTSLSVAPIRGWLRYMKEYATDPQTQLHRSSISRVAQADLPRGCALSWSCQYMAQFASHEAAQLYKAYRRQYSEFHFGFGGFREWPPAQNHGMTVDSGPIFLGVGLAATGIGIGPTRLFQDEAMYATIMRSASLFGIPVQWNGARLYALAPFLGEVILFNGVTARFWFPN